MKVGFVAPEVLMGFRPQLASDIFSVGCVAYFMIAGRRPFTKRNELLNKVKAPELLNIKLSPAGLDFISSCLQKSIGKRLHLERELRCVHQKGWFADMNIYEDFPWSPLIKAIEKLSKDDAFAHEEKCPDAMQ
ncbi:hypothetical protein CHS0354_006646 [Potamilus streckersoni]|uniref:Protein kinase domain-containing protein n=1 Tax=Potamilus streckersoni TaxID=2493646 RepID=A0AAE0SWU1_9BIVA|nr:hypothetical protein CHS0354_006646 [Potamilus streckersoni]